MVQAHQDSSEAGKTKAIPPQKTKNLWHGFSDPQNVLQMHHRELTGCITAGYGNCSASDRQALQRVVSTAQYITGAKLPAIHDLYTRRCQTPATLVKDCSLCYRTASATGASSLGPTGFLTATTPQAIRLLNS